MRDLGNKAAAGREIVVLAGSGRSGTTWLGSLLDTYEGAEYFYEIDAFPDLDFTDPDLLRIKYPLTHWWRARPGWAVRAEQRALAACARLNVGAARARRALRIRNRISYWKCDGPVYLFKIVRLFSFALRAPQLATQLADRLKVVHIVRNPYAQLVSQLRMDAADPGRSQRHFQERLLSIRSEPALERYHALAERCRHASWPEQMALVWWVSNEVMIDDRSLAKCLVIFERLTASPLEETRRIFDFLGWPMSARTREYIRGTTDLQASAPGQFAVKKKAQDVLQRWKKEIRPEDYARVSALLAPCGLLRLWDASELTL